MVIRPSITNIHYIWIKIQRFSAKKYYNAITRESGPLNHRQCDCLLIIMINLTIAKTAKFHITGSLWEESICDFWIPQEGYLTSLPGGIQKSHMDWESVLMFWHHHEAQCFVNCPVTPPPSIWQPLQCDRKQEEGWLLEIYGLFMAQFMCWLSVCLPCWLSGMGWWDNKGRTSAGGAKTGRT